MNVERQPKDLQPPPRLGRAHWARVHYEADRRKPLPSNFVPERKA